ncbi:DNA-processing protein DprA [Actinophytocola algeriensis]|uniref:DNA processing protein n=1 Tax=Actinophytocola algeriensis TaxID=1768010 RepID=A0A7W7QCD4_9PSEU|nr:DNA-processing protein DprA [Actinophytocola algeriensis]MBB4910526.1 DNA processing protein [Actinophytocola algeriensis]MBE1480485.1 DNA processing protein [Actinophytocola algeriensis]
MTAPVGEEIVLARAYLIRVAEPPAFALHAFVDVVGPVEAADLVRRGDVPDAVRSETEARRDLDLASDDLRNAEKVGARLVVPEDPDWPAWQLLCLAPSTGRGPRGTGRPLGLWTRGSVPVANLFDRAVSVVGARSATGYGEHVAAELGFELVQAGMTVVSGAAYGIDGAAHRGALSAGGPTVAVLGCGIDLAYPAGHSGLIEGIAAAGLVVSEYPPGTTPARHRFLVRNRLIAALSSATVVVEAGVRSGARNTAATAASLGKVVMAVPGPITSVMSVGCHDLLRTGGAVVAGSIPEIVEAVGPVGANLDPSRKDLRRSTDGLGEEALRVHDALRREESMDAEQVAVEAGLPLDRVRTLLPELEITGHVTRLDDGWRQQEGGDRHG